MGQTVTRPPQPALGAADENDNRWTAFILGSAWRHGSALTPLAYVGSVIAVGLALACGVVIERFVGLQSVLLVFLMAILVSAIVWGLWPSLVACLLSVLAFNFFLLPPIYTFSIADTDNAIALFFFFIVAVIVSNLTAATRHQIVVARERAKTTAALYAFSRKIAGIGALDDLLWATAHQVASMLNVRTVLLLEADASGLTLAAGYPPEDRLDDAEMAAARYCWEHNNPAGCGAEALPGGSWLFLPLRTGSGPVGVLGAQPNAPETLTAEERRLLDALADQAAVAIERISLARGLAEARVLTETERLRSALLTSVSHDLRTPLASILGTASSLRRYAGAYTEEEREDLLETLEEEAERLSRFVANLLDMTRLESGAIDLKLDLIDIGEVIGASMQRAGSVLARHRVELAIAPDLPMLRIDALLFEQVLFNLLDNAAKYAPAGSRIDVRAHRYQDVVAVEIIDEGPGIPPADLEHVFDKFYRVQAQDRQRAGTGLGLAICRGFIEAQGGRIEAQNRGDRTGAVLAIRIPVPRDVEIPQWVTAPE